ncbi:hypothetical protein [Acinetobacter sp. 243_ASPC]|uniref:hypothetical protein n=1 Tax=Acinetobacter sp. 243_ASPC TaxID=1579345 RepID=UPI0006616FA9|nr:hypothetical protein [Acinetobacter sp. 243_ASPC]
MKVRPILFNAEMVKAILDGRKTQTRRVLRVQPPLTDKNVMPLYTMEPEPKVTEVTMHEIMDDRMPFPSSISRHKCPFGKIGDQLWVRESFGTKIRSLGGTPHESLTYKADNPVEMAYYDCNGKGFPVKWKPSIHMPRWASRILLEITNIRVERLNDISVEDALAEGIAHKTMNCPRHEYFQLWNDVYGEMAHESNPWVWVIQFKAVKGD